MEGRSVLVLLMGDASPARLRAALADRPEPPAHVHVVAPTVVAPLDWLATAEDRAHALAEVRAFEAEWTLAGELEVEVEGAAGDVDPIQAVEDALRTFQADEILIAGDAADAALEEALAHFGLPIGRLVGTPAVRHSRLYRSMRELAAGHTGATPFVFFAAVNTALLLLGLLLSLLALLILWLIGSL
jgi:hypothetical protein